MAQDLDELFAQVVKIATNQILMSTYYTRVFISNLMIRSSFSFSLFWPNPNGHISNQ